MQPDESTELVVALPHEKLVLGAVQEAGAGRAIEVIDRSADLGLSRLLLRDPDRVAESVAAWYASIREEHPTAGGPPPAAGSQRPVNRVLADLRAGFAALNGGWVPTMGKNRAVGRIPGMRNAQPGVSGAGEVSHGGGGPPRKIDEPGWAKARASSPGAGARVGIVDGALRGHDFFAGAWIGSQEHGLPYPDGQLAEAGHATFVSGLVLRQAPGATLQVSALLADEGTADSWDAAIRIVRMGRLGLDVLNLSFVSYTEDGQPPLLLSTAIDRLDPEIVAVAAAGNHGYLSDGQERKVSWPAALNDVVAVGAYGTKGDGAPAPFTPAGAWIDVLAPGEEVESTYLHGIVRVWADPDDDGPQEARRLERRFAGYARWSGTSFATATISGAIAARTVPGRATAREAYEWLTDRATESAVPRVGEPLLIDPDALGRPPWADGR